MVASHVRNLWMLVNGGSHSLLGLRYFFCPIYGPSPASPPEHQPNQPVTNMYSKQGLLYGSYFSRGGAPMYLRRSVC
jgi:hypothetical protein